VDALEERPSLMIGFAVTVFQCNRKPWMPLLFSRLHTTAIAAQHGDNPALVSWTPMLPLLVSIPSLLFGGCLPKATTAERLYESGDDSAAVRVLEQARMADRGFAVWATTSFWSLSRKLPGCRFGCWRTLAGAEVDMLLGEVDLQL
jgi:hypothetical protein